MSRGLSAQQRAILGFGVLINRAVNRGEVVPLPGEPVRLEGWDKPVLLAHGFAEVHIRDILGMMHSVGTRHGGLYGYFRHDRNSLSLKASTHRALASLRRRGLIVH